MDRPVAMDCFSSPPPPLFRHHSSTDRSLMPPLSAPPPPPAVATAAKLPSINCPRPVPRPVTATPDPARFTYAIQIALPPVELPAAPLRAPAAPLTQDSPRSAAPPPPPSSNHRRTDTDLENVKPSVMETHVLTTARSVLACLVRRLEERADAAGPTYSWGDLAPEQPPYYMVPPDWIVHRNASRLLDALPKFAPRQRHEATFILRMISMWPKLNDDERKAVYDQLMRFTLLNGPLKHSPFRCRTERSRQVRRERRPNESKRSRSRSRSTSRRTTEWERPSHRLWVRRS